MDDFLTLLPLYIECMPGFQELLDARKTMLVRRLLKERVERI
jgi:hypothetical protein